MQDVANCTKAVVNVLQMLPLAHTDPTTIVVWLLSNPMNIFLRIVLRSSLPKVHRFHLLLDIDLLQFGGLVIVEVVVVVVVVVVLIVKIVLVGAVLVGLGVEVGVVPNLEVEAGSSSSSSSSSSSRSSGSRSSSTVRWPNHAGQQWT